MNNAIASLEETKYHLLLARDLNYINTNTYNELQSQSEIIGRMLYKLVSYLNNKSYILNPKS